MKVSSRLFLEFLAPLFYIKRADAEIRIIGTVASLRQERSPESTNAPPVTGFVIKSETTFKSERTDSERNVEESKRDVSLEELLSDGSKEGNTNKKSVERNNHLKTRIKSQRKSVASIATGKKVIVRLDLFVATVNSLSIKDLIEYK